MLKGCDTSKVVSVKNSKKSLKTKVLILNVIKGVGWMLTSTTQLSQTDKMLKILKDQCHEV
jgi:hypothetical protein